MEERTKYGRRKVYTSHWVDRILLGVRQAEALGEMVEVCCATCARSCDAPECLLCACSGADVQGDRWIEARPSLRQTPQPLRMA